MTPSFGVYFVNIKSFLEEISTFHIAGFKTLPFLSYSAFTAEVIALYICIQRHVISSHLENSTTTEGT